jgi:exopolysaccharide production protein ExoZ
MAPATIQPTSRLDGLQWGRAIAAVLVVLCHAILHPLPEPSALALYLGDVGVTIFFIISGFIMVTTTGRSSFDQSLFMKRRIIRVVPLYYLATLTVVTIAVVLPNLMKSTQFDGPHLIY